MKFLAARRHVNSSVLNVSELETVAGGDAVTSGGRDLCALDALEAAEVPAFLQAGSDAGQLLSEGAGQPGEQSLHLGRVNLQTELTG